jgi:hypothetical protein
VGATEMRAKMIQRAAEKPLTTEQIMERYGQDLPGEADYYNAIQAMQNRLLSSSIAGQRQHGLNSLEARGLGQSSLVGRYEGELGQAQSQGMSAIGNAIMGQRFQSREGRINDAINFERQKVLNKMNQPKSSPWGSLAKLAGVGAMFIPGVGPAIGSGILAASSMGGSGTQSQPMHNYQTAYDPYHNRPLDY